MEQDVLGTKIRRVVQRDTWDDQVLRLYWWRKWHRPVPYGSMW